MFARTILMASRVLASGPSGCCQKGVLQFDVRHPCPPCMWPVPGHRPAREKRLWKRHHRSPTTQVREHGTGYTVPNNRMARFMAPSLKGNRQLITFMVKPYYSCGCSVYYMQLWSHFITFVVSRFITFMISITFMVNLYYIYGFMSDTTTGTKQELNTSKIII